jgi:hypothetical protein
LVDDRAQSSLAQIHASCESLNPRGSNLCTQSIDPF